MNMYDVQSAAADISAQAQNGTNDAGQMVQNSLSPHFERFAYERIRKTILHLASELEAKVTGEVAALKATIAVEEAEAHQVLDALTASIRQHFRNLF